MKVRRLMIIRVDRNDDLADGMKPAHAASCR
jgi:hypothetical protein